MAAVPQGIAPDAVRHSPAGRPGVSGLHDVHLWPTSNTETAPTAHLSMPGGHAGEAALGESCSGLRERFGIGRATLRVETGKGTACAPAPDHVV